MNTVRKWLTVISRFLFPDRKQDEIFEHLSPALLAQTARRTSVPTEPRTLAPLPYEHALVRNAIHAAKYRGHERAAKLLGAAIAPFVAEELAERRAFGTFTDALMIPIPLHMTRCEKRGYNQSERIARAILEHIGDNTISMETKVLVRTQNTAPQTQQRDKTARRKNMQGVFRVCTPSRVAHRYIILIDDVVTTGATLGAARDALIRAHARDVLCVATAH